MSIEKKSHDQTIIADNVFTKLFCIIVVLITLKNYGFQMSDIGFCKKGIYCGILSGLSLGILTFGISYFIEVLILLLQGHSVSLRFYVTNFALSGTSTQMEATFTAMLICILVNIINVIAEEGLFRGIILKLGATKYNFFIANWIQSSLFGIWHIIMVVVSVNHGLMNIPTAIVMAIGYVILSGILGFEWGTCVSITGTLWVGISEHFFNNFIGNTLHVVTQTGVDELQIVRIVLSNILSLLTVLIVNQYKRKHRPYHI